MAARGRLKIWLKNNPSVPFYSGIAGALVTGGDLQSALISGAIGAATGAFVGATGGLGAGSSGLLGAFSNLTGQVVTNNTDDNECNNLDVNYGSIIGSGFGGVWSAGLTKGMTGISGAIAAGEISFQIETATSAIGGALWNK